MALIRVIPGDGRRLRNPGNRYRLVPPDGAMVNEFDPYWVRRLAAGDAVKVNDAQYKVLQAKVAADKKTAADAKTVADAKAVAAKTAPAPKPAPAPPPKPAPAPVQPAAATAAPAAQKGQ